MTTDKKAGELEAGKVYSWKVRQWDAIRVRFVTLNPHRCEIAECIGVECGKKLYCFVEDLTEA